MYFIGKYIHSIGKYICIFHRSIYVFIGGIFHTFISVLRNKYSPKVFENVHTFIHIRVYMNCVYVCIYTVYIYCAYIPCIYTMHIYCAYILRIYTYITAYMCAYILEYMYVSCVCVYRAMQGHRVR